MKRLIRNVLGWLGAALLAASTLNAQELRQNSIESISVIQQGGILNLKLAFKEPPVALPSGFSIANPARLAFDFPNVVNGVGKSSLSFNEGDLKSVNVIQAEGRTRLVLNLNQAVNYEAKIEGVNLLLALTPFENRDWRKGGVAPKVEHFAQAHPYQAINSIKDIAFRRGTDGEARITVDLNDPSAGIDIRQQGDGLVVDFYRMSVPEGLRKRLDVTDFGTPVTRMETTQQGSNVRMKITPRGLWEHNAYQTDNQFVIEVKQIIEDPNKLVQGSRGGYTGEKLSLNFQNVDVRRLLQVIGEFTGMNMVVSDSVGGSITLILRDVPWDQALDIIMKQKNLDMRKNGNVILIAPREEVATKEKLEFEAKAVANDLAPLATESFPMSYVKGDELRKLLIDPKQTMLSKRGTALLDARSNILFVTDTPSRLEEIRRMVAKIDIPVRQVMIEARIVEAGDSFAKNLGIRLATGATSITTTKDANTGVISTTVAESALGAINPFRRLGQIGAVNLPASPRAGTAGTYGLTLYNADFSQFLRAEISALEADGRGKVISSPRVMTANQIEAVIEQGVEIPYQQATSSGATSIAFRKANLSLKVKPQITPDGKITMMLDINKDSPNTKLSTGAGVAIDTKHVKTEVLIDNGGTVVIGGIYTQNTSNNTQRIPFFGDLPYIGWLFKNREWIDDKTELLVFITPKIVVDNLSIR